jgi:hypothetical protein
LVVEELLVLLALVRLLRLHRRLLLRLRLHHLHLRLIGEGLIGVVHKW